MRKLINFMIVASFFLGVGVGQFSMGSAEASVLLKEPVAETILSEKRCEKCKRGKDGKMVCEPVPCP